ncbi:ANTAR domain-containing protein [Arthrobacter sp. MN05-02]|nr:ANTAR domain-containing protein [Arthrobacter sp. MN05-02]
MQDSFNSSTPDPSEPAPAGSVNSGLGAQLHQAAADSGDIVDFLDYLTKIAVDVLTEPGRDVFCGVTLLRPKRAGTVASSSDQARQMDEVQYRFDDGPCLTAAREEREVYIADVDDLDADSTYRQAMREQGAVSVLAVPILLPGDTYSALNLYSDRRDAFGAGARRVAQKFAAEASKSLSIAAHIATLVDTGTDLRAAMKNRGTIDTAIGVIMAQNTCSQEQAFSILRRAASTRNMKLHELADSLITSVPADTPGTV